MDILARFPFLFPLYFAALWLTVTTVLGVLTGWFGMMQRFPDRDETALATLRRQSGIMGFWVAMSRILSLSPCPSGLRVAIMRLFGPFSRPFLVPWSEVRAARSSFLFAPMIKLTFGASEHGALWLYPRTWQRLLESAPGAASSRMAGSLGGSSRMRHHASTLRRQAHYEAPAQSPLRPRELDQRLDHVPIRIVERIDIRPSGFGRFHEVRPAPREPLAAELSDKHIGRKAGEAPVAIWIGVYPGKLVVKPYCDLVERVGLVVDPIANGVAKLLELRLDQVVVDADPAPDLL
jgi:hypothetical protein